MRTGLLYAADGVDYNAAAAKNRTGRCKNGEGGGGGQEMLLFLLCSTSKRHAMH